MKQASDYPITGPYGEAKGYPLNPVPGKPGYGFHKGEDRAMPIGTPVFVNGTQIGLSGNTGASTGPHLHIGKWNGGTVLPPQGQGFTLDSPTVSYAGFDTSNGNHVKLLDSHGMTWIYDHLSQINVKVGDKLAMADKVDANLSKVLQHGILGRNGLDGRPDALAGQTDTPWVGTDLTTAFVMSIYNSPEAQAWRGSQTDPTSIPSINAQLKGGPPPAAATQLKPGLYKV